MTVEKLCFFHKHILTVKTLRIHTLIYIDYTIDENENIVIYAKIIKTNDVLLHEHFFFFNVYVKLFFLYQLEIRVVKNYSHFLKNSIFHLQRHSTARSIFVKYLRSSGFICHFSLRNSTNFNIY